MASTEDEANFGSFVLTITIRPIDLQRLASTRLSSCLWTSETILELTLGLDSDSESL